MKTSKKILTPKTNLDKLDYILKAKSVDSTYRACVKHLKKVLAPKIKGTVCQEILELHTQGYSNKEITDMGYNKVTVSRQVKEYRAKTTFAIDFVADKE